MPGNQGVQAYDRYTYTSNNPLRYTYPSGHCAIDADADECFRPGFNNPPSLAQQLGQYGITTTNATSAQNQSTLQAAQLAGNKLAETIGGGISAQDAFRQAQGNISITFGADRGDCITYDYSITCGNTEPSWLVQTIIHEFGHVFDNQFQDLVDGEFFASSYPINGWDATVEGYKPGYDNGFPSMQHPFPRTGARGQDEDFADMYLNWVLDMNPAFPDNGFTTDDWGNDRRDMMNNTVDDPTRRGMAVWLQMMGLR